MSGGGSKGGTRPVYDFLTTIDYGIAHGPLSSINQIWVKDKPILCGQYTVDQIETVYLPDRHGGDDAEGGVGGVVELYMGTDNQLMSNALAARFGEVAANWVGYQGLSHVAFRGATSGLADGVLNTGPDVLDGTLYSSDNGQGFWFTSNNPYFPEVKIHCTRFADNLGLALPAIPSIADIGMFGLTFVDANNGYQLGGGGVLDEYFPPTPNLSISYNNWLTHLDTVFPPTGPTYPNLVNHFQDVATALTNQGGAGTGVASRPTPVNLDEPTANAYYDIGINNTPPYADHDGVAGSVGTFRDDVTSVYSITDHHLLTFGDNGTGSLPDATDLSFGLTTSQHFANGTIGLFFPIQFSAGGGFNAQGSMTAWCKIWTGSAQGSEDTLIFDQQLTLQYGEDETRYLALHWTPGEPYLRVEYFIDMNFTQVDTQQNWLAGGSVRIGQVQYSDSTISTNRLGSFWGVAASYENAPLPTYNYCQPNGDLSGFPDENPACIIYELLTDPEWGKGENPANIDIASFQAAGATLISERMGMSEIWVKQDTIESMIQDVLDHIKAFLFINPQTGLYQLRLLRYDYTVGSLPTLDETNCKLRKRKRRAWGETINEIVVSYTDPNNEEPATVSAQDDGNISLQGFVVSETREYSGFRNPFIAQYVAERDVTESAYPIFSAVAEVDRRMWNVLPGDVFELSWAKDSISAMVVRVMGVNYGRPGSKKMKLELVEDIFALDLTTYGAPQQGSFTPADSDPIPFDHEFAANAPIPLLQKAGITATDIDNNYPEAGVYLGGAHISIRTSDFQAHTNVNLPNGTSAIQSVMTNGPQQVGVIQAGDEQIEEASSTLLDTYVNQAFNGTPSAGDIGVFGDPDGVHEFFMLDVNNTGSWTVARGMWDTTPLAWAAGTLVWGLKPMTAMLDPNRRTNAEFRTYRLLPRTSIGRLNYSAASDVNITVNERPHLPFRPANCRLGGSTFFGTHVDSGASSFSADWSNRNRTQEDAVYNKWLAGNVTPEVGQTTTIRIRDPLDVLLHEYTGLTGTTQTITAADFAPDTVGYVEFIAVNGIGESLYNHRIDFDIT